MGVLATATPADMGICNYPEVILAETPGIRQDNQRVGGHPPLDVDFKAVCDAVSRARNGNGEIVTEVAERFGVSRGWIYLRVYKELECVRR